MGQNAEVHDFDTNLRWVLIHFWETYPAEVKNKDQGFRVILKTTVLL